MNTIRRTITIITVTLLFTASLAESSIFFVCSMIACPDSDSCIQPEPVECEPVITSCCAQQAMAACQPTIPVEPEPPVKPVCETFSCSPASVDDTQRSCVIDLTSELLFKHKCDKDWHLPLLTSVIVEYNLLPRAETDLIDSKVDHDRSKDSELTKIVNSRPCGVHLTILTTVVRC